MANEMLANPQCFVWRQRLPETVAVSSIEEFVLVEHSGIHWYGTRTRWSDLGVENHGLKNVTVEELKAAGFTYVHSHPLPG